MELRINPRFEKLFTSFLGEGKYKKLLACIAKKPRDCIRVNTLKITKAKLKRILMKKGWKLSEVPWFKQAFFVETNESIGKTLEHVLGYYYTQDGSSLVPPIVLDPKPGEKVLDLCAAPGSKTTQIAAMMQNRGAIVANDVSAKRCKALQFNLQRCGVVNTIVTIYDGRKFHELGLTFDRVLVDAPCTGTGKLIGEQAKGVLRAWRGYAALKLARLQRKLLESAVLCTKKGGVIVYSTCSLDPRENEEVISKIVEKFDLKILPVKVRGLKCEPALKSFAGKEFARDIENAIRIYPWHNLTEGFFVCKLKVRG